jgi:hypothetical protein
MISILNLTFSDSYDIDKIPIFGAPQTGFENTNITRFARKRYSQSIFTPMLSAVLVETQIWGRYTDSILGHGAIQ